MKNLVLSIEQMQELKELGVDTSKASLYWYATDESEFVCFGTDIDKDCGDEISPTFTLQDLLSIINEYSIKVFNYNGIIQYNIQVKNKSITSDTSLLEAAFNMLKWCKQNNYI